MSVVELGRFMDDLADASGKAILPFFRAQFGLDDKARGGAPFDPVTEADRAAEVVLRAMIGQTFRATASSARNSARNAPMPSASGFSIRSTAPGPSSRACRPGAR
jgi:hypothetical protein